MQSHHTNAECARVLVQAPGHLQAAAARRIDPDGREAVVAYLSSQPRLSASELAVLDGRLRGRLPFHLIPALLQPGQDPLPMMAHGEVSCVASCFTMRPECHSQPGWLCWTAWWEAVQHSVSFAVGKLALPQVPARHLNPALLQPEHQAGALPLQLTVRCWGARPSELHLSTSQARWTQLYQPWHSCWCHPCSCSTVLSISCWSR